MDCREFKSRLRRMQEWSPSPDEYQAFEDHLSECPDCRRMTEVSLERIEVPEDLISSVLDKTSGPACRRVQDNLCSFVDGVLESGYRELIALHLEHCPACSALAAQLAELHDLLPQMAELEPGAGFTSRVLRKTSRLRNEPRPDVYELMRRWWMQLVRRPRFSLEAAYLGTVLLVVLMGNPLPSMLNLSHRAATLFRAEASFSLINLALPGSLISGESETLRWARDFSGAVSERERQFEESAKGMVQQGALMFQASHGSIRASLGSLPAKCQSILHRIRLYLFPRHP